MSDDANAGGGSSPDRSRDEPSSSNSGDEPAPSGPGESVPADADGPAALLAQLGVRSHAKTGIVVATAVAIVVYSPWILRLWTDGTDELVSALSYLSLTFVLWFSVAFSIAVFLTVRAGLRPVLDHAAWLRRGGGAAIVGGLGWVLLPVVAGTLDVGAWRVWTIASCILLLVGTTGLHASVKSAAGRIEAGGYLVVLVGLSIAAANATGSPAPTTTVDGTVIASPFLLGTFLALVGTVALAAGADLTGRLPALPVQGLLFGALLGVLAVAWLFSLDGIAAVPPEWTDAVVLALVTAPAGIAWILVGWTLRTSAADVLLDAGPDAPSKQYTRT